MLIMKMCDLEFLGIKNCRRWNEMSVEVMVNCSVVEKQFCYFRFCYVFAILLVDFETKPEISKTLFDEFLMRVNKRRGFDDMQHRVLRRK